MALLEQEVTTNDTKPKSKRKHSTGAHEEASITIRTPPWYYIHLELITTPPSSIPLDILTARTHLTSALSQFLGLTGTAIPIDFLKVAGREVWIRVPREDGSAVVAAAGGWMGGNGSGVKEGEQVGWRVRGMGKWLGGLVAGSGMELYER
ncbi:MAG: hypothetical protein M1827_000528 [Pycnora praestabilis]|nr:MAG: hypothetical protein M1827_000528 [Pycnora praestabilis]